jgi:hypothetical protein
MPAATLRRFPLTAMALGVAVTVFAVSAIGNVDFITLPLTFIAGIGHHELDEIALSLVLVVVAFLIDQRTAATREARETALHAEQLRVVHVTMRTVQDLVNNCLNQLQLLRMDADGLVPPDTLNHFDAVIQETAAKLTELGNLRSFEETRMASGLGLAVPPQPTTP